MAGAIPEDGGLDPGGGGEGESGNDQLRGWVSPDDRLWRHPSESGHAPRAPDWHVTRRHPAHWHPAHWHPAQAPGRPPLPGSGARSSARWMAGSALACLAIVLLVGGTALAVKGASPARVVATSPASVHLRSASGPLLTTTPTTEARPVSVPTDAVVSRMVSGVLPSLVALEAVSRGHTVESTAVVVEDGGLAVTSASVVSGASSLWSIGAGGTRNRVSVVGIDPTSGIALVHVAGDRPVASFNTDDDLDPGTTALAVSLHPAGRRSAGPTVSIDAGTVLATVDTQDGLRIPLSATLVNVPLAGGNTGCALLDPSGRVAGILDAVTGVGSHEESLFLPANLVVGVAHQLAATGTVEHGWLGLYALGASATAPPPSAGGGAPPDASSSAPPGAASAGAGGVTVGSVVPGSPAAAAGISAGDTVTRIDGEPVRTIADLRTQIYPDPPGTEVELTVVRSGRTYTVPVVMTSPPGGAS